MNEHEHPSTINRLTYAELAEAKRAAKKLRKRVRKVIRTDLQARAITGGPSPFKRAPQ